MRRCSPFVVALSLWLSLALGACAADEDTPVPDTCTPAGGECARADRPFVARRPPAATCIDYGAWVRGRPYTYRDVPGPPLTCPGTPEVCCFARDASP
jgi:hypothetical protein